MQVLIKGTERQIRLTKRERETLDTAVQLCHELSRQLNEPLVTEAANNITEVLTELEGGDGTS